MRVPGNILLACVLAGCSLYLLGQESFVLNSRQTPGTGRLFSGLALYLLALSPLGLAGVALSVARAWLKGDVPLPDNILHPHPAYKGELMLRFWPWLAVALGSLLLAFVLAEPFIAP